MQVDLEINYSYYSKLKNEFDLLLKQISSFVFDLTNNTLFDIQYISIKFVTENEIIKLNKFYRNKNYPTDVISLCYWENQVKTPMVGELFICVNVAKKQAKLYNHSFKRELCFLFIHGLLHLLGYDHENKNDEKIMFNLQNEILNHFNIRR